MNIKDRFLKYVSFDTQSDPHSETAPSSMKQFELARYLEEEMKAMGISNVSVSEHCVVYGMIPSNNGNKGDVLGFIAHMDTSPDASGKDIKTQYIEDYDGSVIVLNKDKELCLDPKEFKVLNSLVGHELITTDGTTLLGADDKAGVAIIMQLCEYLLEHPEIKHNDIKIAFTPDEEVGRGTENFSVEHFNAQYAYTIDGGDINEIEYENFNAFSAEVKITGKSIHPGSAKNAMINSVRIANEFDNMLPAMMRPEYTEGYEGFNHLHSIKGGCEETFMHYIIRNHDLDLAKKQCQDFIDVAHFLNHKYGYDMVSVDISESYLNMKEHILDNMFIVDQAMEAMRECGLDAHAAPIRGGTDGARLTYEGLPCPNLGTGGFNFHGPFEFVSLTMMKKQVEVLLKIIDLSKGE